jgi:hypothetical protein
MILISSLSSPFHVFSGGVIEKVFLMVGFKESHSQTRASAPPTSKDRKGAFLNLGATLKVCPIPDSPCRLTLSLLNNTRFPLRQLCEESETMGPLQMDQAPSSRSSQALPGMNYE